MERVSSLYIHFPFCRHLCNYCDFYKKETPEGPLGEQLSSYYTVLRESISKLKKEMSNLEYTLEPMETIYIGGGTPSLWGNELAPTLKNLFKESGITLAKDIEFTMECNPDSINQSQLDEWKSFGINRFSVGIQSLDSTLFKYLDRVHDLNASFEALALLKKNNINFSADLMLGLPKPDGYKRNIEREIDDILAHSPKHISLYILKVNKGYKYFDLLPNEDDVADEYELVYELLSERGFDQYEISNFAIKGYESKHNLRYWDQNSVLALGPSATGYFASSQVRYKWLTEKIEFTQERLNDSELKLEKLFLSLRTFRGLDFNEFFSNKDSLELAKFWEKRGLAKVVGSHVSLTNHGYLVIDSLVDELFSRNFI